jgi:hypothetical protein
MKLLFVLIALFAAGPAGADPAPLTQPQIAQIRKLVQATKNHEAKIQSLLIERQKELIAAYAEFELDENRIKLLQEEIADLQRQSLANYHRFQKGLRKATGREHFETIKSRVDRYVHPKESEAQSDVPPSGEPQPIQ